MVEKKETISKTAAKVEKKQETPKQETKPTKKAEKPKKEKKVVKKVKIKSTKENKKIKEQIKNKNTEEFKGRFGQRQKRKLKFKKWNKWRKPRGIDIKREKEDGVMPKTGYQTPKAIRNLHPLGYKEVLVENPADLEKLDKDCVARIAGTVGRKKREQIMEQAFNKGVRIIN